MLDARTIAVIKSTVPVLEVHGQAITSTFYQILFKNHPELLNYFNHANQFQGRQSAALANAVYAAAAHIDSLQDIMPTVKGIAQKHRALGILPEHYPIVGANLLAAIKEVLGDAATDEIMEAWEQAYGVIADAFISVEAGLYHQAELQPGGWSGFRTFVVERKVEESEVITSFYLKPQDGQPIAAFTPGQYITVRVKPDNQPYIQLRHYSLSNAPSDSTYRISVKREDGLANQPGGVVSVYLHEKLQEGDTIDLSAPAGEFVLEHAHDKPIVLISGGVGITPMFSMLEALLQQQTNRPIIFIHAAQTEKLHAWKKELLQYTEQFPQLQSYIVYDQGEAGILCDRIGYIDLPWLQSVAPASGDFYFCGPTAFMQAIHSYLKQWNISDERIHYEFFGPAGTLSS